MNGATDSLRFAFAGPDDDADLRALLRASPLRGAISVALTHEPDYFQTPAPAGAEDRTLIARENGRLVAAGRCIIQPRWLNGEVRRTAYLGELRLAPAAQGRWDILRRGYAFFAAEYARQPADFCFTSVIADNTRARQLFERGLPGLPRYEPLASYHTLLLRARRTAPPQPPAGMELVRGDAVPLAQLATFLNTFGRTRNLALHWTAESLAGLAARGLPLHDFIVLRQSDTIAGCAAVWDQRAFRQVVVDGYAPWLAALRPLANLAGAFRGWPRLPAPGATLAHAFLSPVAITPECAGTLPTLVGAGLAAAARRGLDCLAVGFPEADPLWLALACHCRGRIYASRLYAVSWPGLVAGVSKLDARPCLPELALL